MLKHLAVCSTALTLLAADKPAPSYDKWLEQDVPYIITNQERREFQRHPSDFLIEQFWLHRDPTPDTIQNEFKEEHYRRIAYANQHFATTIPGWKTDRGYAYILLGPPDEIESNPSSELWRYRYIEGVGANIVIEFVDSKPSSDLVPVALGESYTRLKPPQVKNKDLEAMVNTKSFSDPLPLRVRVDFFPLTEFATLTNITVLFDNRDFRFENRNGISSAAVDLYGRVAGTYADIFEDRVAVQAPTAMLPAMINRQSIYQQSVPLPAGRYRLNVVVEDRQSGRANNYELALDVPSLEHELSASSLIVADLVEHVSMRNIGAGHFVIGGTKVRPRVSESFRAEEKLGIYTQLYGFTPDATTIEYYVLNNRTNQDVLAFTEPVSGPPCQVTIEKLLPLKNFSYGEYTLKLKVTDYAANRTLARSATFTVMP